MHQRIKQRLRQNNQENTSSGSSDGKCSLIGIVKLCKEITDESRRNIQRAVIGLGPYRLAEEVRDLEISPERWRNMNDRQKGESIKKLDPTYQGATASSSSRQPG